MSPFNEYTIYIYLAFYRPFSGFYALMLGIYLEFNMTGWGVVHGSIIVALY